MKLVTLKNFVLVGGLAFLVLIGASFEAQAQGRGRGNSKWDKKCAKFVNCHDASEGRWDGRGPRRDNDNWSSGRYRHRRDSDRFDDNRRRRHHRRDWRSDRNGDWRHRDRDRGSNRTWVRHGR